MNEVKEVRGTVTRIGRGEVGAHTDPINSAEITVLLKPESEWREGFAQTDIEEAIREKISSFPEYLLTLLSLFRCQLMNYSKVLKPNLPLNYSVTI
ncbi:MAG: hypothetical protein U5K00_15775 [Melioribacteraceae bacterium]|nr:hypothetical protein [Melioribacteraceae bacterium]